MNARHIFSRFSIQIGVTVILVGLLSLFMFLSPQTFLHGRIYISFASTIPFSMLLAVGLTFCIISGELDLSFPSVMAISGLAFVTVYQATDSPMLGLVACLSTGVAAGFINGLIVVKAGVSSIIATIGTQFLWRGAAIVLADGLALNVVEVRETYLHALFVGRLWGVVPAQALWCAVLCCLAWLLMNRHVFGDSLQFIGDNAKTARMVGIAVDRDRMFLFMGMGVVSSFVSFMICLEMANWWPTQGEGYLMVIFASVFIGGTSAFGGRGTIYGTVIGALIIGIIEAGLISSGFSGFWTRLVYGLIIVLSVTLYATIQKANSK